MGTRVPLPDTGKLPSWADMVHGCLRLTAAVPEIVLPTHRFSIVQVRPYRMPIGWTVNLHQHAFYEASLLLQGQTHYGGETGPRQQRLKPGHVYYHAPYVPHAWRANRGACVRLILWFSVEPAVPLPAPDRWPVLPGLLGDAIRLLQLVAHPTPGWQNHAAARLGAILSQLVTLGQFPREADTDLQLADTFTTQVDSFLADNLRYPIQLTDIANAVGVSASGLVHRYRQGTGATVGQKLLALRMEEAVHLLKTTGLPLKAVCDQVGVSEPAYLCRLFKRYYRVSPGEYRERLARQSKSRSQRSPS